MHELLESRRDAIAGLCRRYGVKSLEVFGSAARGADFEPNSSDADFLVSFEHGGTLSPATRFFRPSDALEAVLGRPVDLIDRGSIENSRNYIRRRRILAEALPIYG